MKYEEKLEYLQENHLTAFVKTRQEEIIEAARSRAERHQIAEMKVYGGDKCNYSYARIYNSEMASFEVGAEWADKHPKSPWISVKDDLPCNHKELLLSTGYHTVGVFTYKKGGACGMDNMIIRNGKWEWESWKENYLYWMPIPNLPKE